MNVAIAARDFAYREKLAAALRSRGVQVYSVPDVAGVLSAAEQARLQIALVAPDILSSEQIDLRAQIRARAGYDASVIALANQSDGSDALARHGATLARRAPDDVVGMADWLRELAASLPAADGLAPGEHWGESAAMSAEGAELGADGVGPTILVVEDEPSFRHFLCDALGDRGYRVYHSANGADALRFLRQHPADLVISDINMPAMNGFELKQEIDMWTKKPTPFVMMTADGRRDNAEDASSLGVVFVLAKPIRNLDSLYAIVTEALRKPAQT